MAVMEGNTESVEMEAIEDDDINQPGVDGDGFPDVDEFNAMIAQTSGSGEDGDFDEDFDLEVDGDSEDPEYEDLPEMEIILHNLDMN